MKYLIVIALALSSQAALAQGYELRSFPQPDIIQGMHQTVLSTGAACPSVIGVWGVMQNGRFQNVAKVTCSNNSEYQVTEIGGRTFVKGWSGTLIGR